MRSYTNTLLFETVLDVTEESSPLVSSVAKQIFKPVILLVEEDCETLLGTFVPLNYDVEGLIELETDLPLTRERIQLLLQEGKTEVSTRTTSSCVSSGGVCRKCAAASFPGVVLPAVGESFQFFPGTILQIDRVSTGTSGEGVSLQYEQNQFDYLLVYNNGQILPQSEYSITNSYLTLVTPSPNTYLTIKYVVETNLPYFYWLADTYSGSLLGVKSLPSLRLPFRCSVIRSTIPKEDINVLAEMLFKEPNVPEDAIRYIPNIKDDLEKALLVIFLGSIFLTS